MLCSAGWYHLASNGVERDWYIVRFFPYICYALKKPVYIVTLLVFFCFAFWGCQKKLFKKVELHGRVLNFITKAPINASITLYGNYSSSNQTSTFLGSTNTNGDGTFSLKTPAAVHEKYDLRITDNISLTLNPNVSLKDNSDIDIGTLFMGTFTFNCKITINPIDGSAIDILFAGANATNIHFNAGTSTSFKTFQTYDYSAYHQNNNSFPIRYRKYPVGVAKDTTVFVPAPNQDTLSVTINY